MYDAIKLPSGQRYPTASQYLSTLTRLTELVTQYNKDAVDYDTKLLSRILKRQIQVKKII